jgi:hypothetical protein
LEFNYSTEISCIIQGVLAESLITVWMLVDGNYCKHDEIWEVCGQGGEQVLIQLTNEVFEVAIIRCS